MDDTELNVVRCLLCPKAFASKIALSNHVRLEHEEAYVAGDSSAWILIDKDSNEKTEPDAVKCLLCAKGFASEVALKNHARLQHTKAFETGDPSIWKSQKASKPKKNKKKQMSLLRINHMPTDYPDEVNSSDGHVPTDPIVFVEIKREMDDDEDSNYSLPVETIIEEAKCNVDSVGAFVELTDSECTVEESNSPPTITRSRTLNIWPKMNKIHIGIPVLTHKTQLPKQFKGKSLLKNQFKCTVCERKFNQQNNLDRHYRTHTNEKPYRCRICNKCFTQLNNLERHVKIHTCEKQFQCAVCKKCFNQKNNLERHFRTHTSEKPFQCVLCDRRFNQKNNLDRHFRCHTGEEQFICFICKMAFNQKNNLDRHMRVHDEKNQYYHQMIKKLV